MAQLVTGFSSPSRYRSRFEFISDIENRVTVTNVVDPMEFYCVRCTKLPSLASNSAKIKAMEHDLRAVNCEKLRRGDAILMRDPQGIWFRTRVQDLDAAKKVVHGKFMDTGITAVASFDAVRELPDEYAKEPPFATQCALHNCHPPNGNWTKENIKFFEELCFRKDSYALHAVKVEALTVYGDLLDAVHSGEFSVTDTMIMNGHGSICAIMDDEDDEIKEGTHEWVVVGESDETKDGN